MNDLMVDIETLGTGHNALIVQIGACYFDRQTGKIGATFCYNIDIQSSLDQGFEIDGDTLQFWFKQPQRSFLEDPIQIETALKHFARFTAWFTECVWAHAAFDFPILTNAYRRLDFDMPLHFRAMRDLRTLVDLAGVDYKEDRGEKTHNALEDCLYQVKYCVKCFRNFQNGKKT